MSALLVACLVIGVADGDSLKVKCPARAAALSVRLAGIDAPEIEHKAFGIREQPWGREAKAALTTLCLKRPAVVHVIKPDPKYRGRTIGKVDCDGVDASTYQVRSGNAWAYLYSARSPLPKLEAPARTERLGLWASPDPIKPSEWRKVKP